MTGRSRYVHGTDPDEQRRLATLNDLLNAACLRETNVRRASASSMRARDSGSSRARSRPPAKRTCSSCALLELRAGDAYAFPARARLDP